MKEEQFRQQFQTFQHSAFRLEQLTSYETGSEDEALRRWKLGNTPPDFLTHTPWQDRVRKWRAEGKRLERVRVISAPLSDYLRMGVEWWYPHNIAAGEETFGLDIESNSVELPQHDFWMFDEKVVVLMHYDDAGRFVAPELVPDSELVRYQEFRRVLLAAAEPLEVAYNRVLASVLQGIEQ